MAKLISTPKFLCQSKLLSRVSYGHVSYLMAGADIIESCQHISCLSCRAQLWKLGDWEKGKVGKKICHDPLGAKIKKDCLASRFRLPNCGKFPRLNIAVFCKEPICCWESPTQLLLMQIPVNWSPWLFSPWWSGLIWYGLRLFGSLAKVHSAQIWPQNMENSSGITERNQSNWVWTNTL